MTPREQWKPLGKLHRPRFYRYGVVFPRRFGVVPNTYPGCVIGLAIVVNGWAYCVKWGHAV